MESYTRKNRVSHCSTPLLGAQSWRPQRFAPASKTPKNMPNKMTYSHPRDNPICQQCGVWADPEVTQCHKIRFGANERVPWGTPKCSPQLVWSTKMPESVLDYKVPSLEGTVWNRVWRICAYSKSLRRRSIQTCGVSDNLYLRMHTIKSNVENDYR